MKKNSILGLILTKTPLRENFFNTKQGFTLIELLVATVIIGILSIVSTQMLFDAISIKSKQNAIQTSNDTGYVILEQITRNVRQAQSINIPTNDSIEITYKSICINYRYNLTNLSIEKAQETNPPCNPSVYTIITPEELNVTNVNFSPLGESPENVSVLIEGEIKDSLGAHPIKYQTNVKTRISL